METDNILNLMAQYDFNKPISVTMIFDSTEDDMTSNVLKEQVVQNSENTHNLESIIGKNLLNKAQTPMDYETSGNTKENTQTTNNICLDKQNETVHNENSILERTQSFVESTLKEQQNVSDAYNDINENRESAHITNTLNIIVANIIPIVRFYVYYNSSSPNSQLSPEIKKHWSDYKNKYFNFSFNIVEPLITPQVKNKKIIKQLIEKIVTEANVKYNLKLERHDVEPFINEMLTWAKYKQYKKSSLRRPSENGFNNNRTDCNNTNDNKRHSSRNNNSTTHTINPLDFVPASRMKENRPNDKRMIENRINNETNGNLTHEHVVNYNRTNNGVNDNLINEYGINDYRTNNGRNGNLTNEHWINDDRTNNEMNGNLTNEHVIDNNRANNGMNYKLTNGHGINDNRINNGINGNLTNGQGINDNRMHNGINGNLTNGHGINDSRINNGKNGNLTNGQGINDNRINNGINSNLMIRQGMNNNRMYTGINGNLTNGHGINDNRINNGKNDNLTNGQEINDNRMNNGLNGNLTNGHGINYKSINHANNDRLTNEHVINDNRTNDTTNHNLTNEHRINENRLLKQHLATPPRSLNAFNQTPNDNESGRENTTCIFSATYPGGNLSVNVNRDILRNHTALQNNGPTRQSTTNSMQISGSSNVMTTNIQYAPPRLAAPDGNRLLHRINNSQINSGHLTSMGTYPPPPPYPGSQTTLQIPENVQNNIHRMQVSLAPNNQSNHTQRNENISFNDTNFEVMHGQQAEWSHPLPKISEVTSLYLPPSRHIGACCVCGKPTRMICSKCKNFSYCSSLCQELDGDNQKCWKT